jgi:hypothetical protein
MKNELLEVSENPEAEIARLRYELRHERALNAHAECMQVALANMLHCAHNWPSIVDAVRDLVMEHTT